MNSFGSGSANPLRLVPAQPVTARKLGHFTIEILYRQNQSMQGRIIVPDRGETPAGRQSFRSDIELLHLMREYMPERPFSFQIIRRMRGNCPASGVFSSARILPHTKKAGARSAPAFL